MTCCNAEIERWKCTLPEGHSGLHLASPTRFVWGEWTAFADRETLANAERLEAEQGGIITAEKLHMGILGNWIGWEAQEQPNARTAPIRTVRGGKLESYAIADMYMSPVIIVVNGAEYRVSPSQHFIWRKA